ncbi:MAG: transposase [Candidatus Omnitrophica bacterium]|nr:transposase [Candidatus Omnitrophota bacterium]
MPHIKRLLIEGYCYHLITRGNQKQKVFHCSEDYLMYLMLLKKFKRKYKFLIYAYCLMPNHAHLLGEIKDILCLSSFMHDLNRTYTLYFNRKYEKVGHLWQGRFKSKIICKDRYLLDCLTYIEMNPVRSNLITNAADYPWSSYKARILDGHDFVLDELMGL